MEAGFRQEIWVGGLSPSLLGHGQIPDGGPKGDFPRKRVCLSYLGYELKPTVRRTILLKSADILRHTPHSLL